MVRSAVSLYTPPAPTNATEIDRRTLLKLAGGSALYLSWLGCGGPSIPLQTEGKVIVVGAGLSGLTTAILLEERGVEVSVLEGRDRAGGRVHTLDDVVGSPEGGGPVIGGSYERLLRIANTVTVNVGPSAGFEPTLLLHVNDQSVDFQAWAGSPANTLVAAERQMPPSRILGYYAALNLPLEGPADWIDPRFAEYDIPLDEYLRRQGASDEALRLVNIAPNTNDIATSSALWALRDAYRRASAGGHGILAAEGGNSQLIDRMAAALKVPVQFGKTVTAVRSDDERVEVLCDDGSSHSAEYCVLTLPFSVLRQIEIDPPLQGLQKEAVDEIPYTAITKYFLVPSRPYWEEDGQPPSMWTDTGLERIFPIRNQQGDIACLICWVDGARAQELDALTEQEQKEEILGELARIRPSSTGAVEVAKVVSWGRDPYAAGAYAHYAPGQVSRLKATMAQPWQRLHFAGEHTAVESPGMESAVESAERAATEVLQRLA
jgi:monoamine oxidase